LTVYRMEEMSTPALDALDRDRTAVVLTVSPLEEHGPHLPVGVDAFVARHFARAIADRLVTRRPGWSVVLAPTLHLGSFTFETVGTVSVRQRVVRDTLADYGRSFARAGFRYIFVANGHGGPGHLAALDEASALVSRRYGVTMASLTGYLAWEFFRGRYLPKIEAGLGRTLRDEEKQAFSEDAHGGWWETSLMLMLRPELVDDSYRDLPPARFSMAERVVPNYPLRSGGLGYVGHPAMADPVFAKVTTDVLLSEASDMIDGLIDGTLRPADRRSPFFSIPFLRTNFWRGLTAAGIVAATVGATWMGLRRTKR
jgi:creatinine amidohydrolase